MKNKTKTFDEKFEQRLKDLDIFVKELIKQNDIEFYSYCEKIGLNIKNPNREYKITQNNCNILMQL